MGTTKKFSASTAFDDMKHYLLIAALAALLVGCDTTPKSEDPFRDFLEITGEIESGLKYSVAVVYRTKSELSECTYYHTMAGKRFPLDKEFTYSPSIIDEKHSLKIPLFEIRDDTKCEWQPVAVYLQIWDEAIGEKPRLRSSWFSIKNKVAYFDEDSGTTILYRGKGFWLNGPRPDVSVPFEINQSYSVHIIRNTDP